MSEVERSGREEVWIEKYRPQTLSDVVGHETIVERLQSYVDRNDLSHMLFAGPAGTGKCVTGETPVLTSDGVARINRLVGDADGFEQAPPSLQVLSLIDDREFEYTRPSHVFSKPTSDGVRIETRDGNSITATPEHRVLVLTHDGLEWRCADDLESGDRIVRPLDVPFPESDLAIDWIDELDGEKTHVHVSEAFAHEHDIPLEEGFVGTKKEIVCGLRNGRSNEEIAASADTTTKYVAQVARDLSDESFDDVGTVCSLSYLRDCGISGDRLRTAIEAIQNVSPENGSRSPPIEPVWECTPELASFLGLAISEARIENGRIKFYNTDEDLLDRFEQSARTLFDLDPDRGIQHDVPFVKCNTRSLTRFLNCCSTTFEAATGGDPGAVGSLLVSADAHSRSAFLRAFFDAEAHVSKNGFIELSQKDGRLVSLLSYLLAGVGIPSRRKTERKAASNGTGDEQTYHTLSISGAPAIQRFQNSIGFSVDHKREALATHVEKTANPNHDTVPVQNAVDDLCERLALTKSSAVPASLDSTSPGRLAYTDAVESVVEAASSKLETAQTVRTELTQIEPKIRSLSQLPIQWSEQRTALADGKTLEAAAGVTGINKGRIEEYAVGERTPYATRTMGLLEQASGVDFPDVRLVQERLHSAIERLDISYNRVAENTSMLGTDVANLLTNDDWEVSSMPRFATVADRVKTITDEMLSMSTLERLSTLDSLVEADLYFDEVTTVEPISDNLDVYDLTVPDHRNYVAGQVPTVMHNTTSATAIARELYGDDWQEHFLELNASDERGIDVVRDRIKSFARTSFGGVDYRIIFLDEADALTSDAQSALRRTMEQFSNNVRFVMSCNYSSQIIDPIQSRCAVFRFSPLGEAAVEAEIRHIADEEGIELTDDGVDALVYAAGGDMRKAINGLQAASVSGDVVDEEAVFAITSTARPEVIQGMVQDAIDGDFTAARSQLDDLITDEGIAGGDIIDQLHRSIWEFDVPDEQAVRILDRVGETDYRITEGANERIQLEAMLASLSLDD